MGAASRWHHAGLASALDTLHASGSSPGTSGGQAWPAHFSVALFLACFQAVTASNSSLSCLSGSQIAAGAFAQQQLVFFQTSREDVEGSSWNRRNIAAFRP